MSRPRASAAACFALSVLLSANAATALDARGCVGAADAAQRLRLAGNLLAAQDALVSCADASCPTVVRVACSEWLGDIKKSIPTVVLAAKETTSRCDLDGAHAETHDLFDVDVRLDGRLLTRRLDGRAIPIDPGSHALRFDLPDASVAPREETLQIREGEKLRAIDVTLTRGPPEPCVPSASTRGSATTVAVYVTAGVSLASFGAFAYFAASSDAKYHDLTRTCAPSCGSQQRASFLVEQDLADVSLGVGILAAALATWLFVTASAGHAALQPVGRGAELRLSF